MKYIGYLLTTMWSIYSYLSFDNLKPSDNIWLWLLAACTSLYSIFGIIEILHHKK